MMDIRGIAVACLVGVVAGCSYDTRVVEGTTDVIPNQGGIIYSADGLFGIRLVPALVKRGVSIQTRRDFQIQGVSSLVYEVVFSGDRLDAEQVFFDTSAVDSPGTKVMVTVDGGELTYVHSTLYPAISRLAADNQDLSRRFFALFELGYDNADCDNKSCGGPCLHCEASATGCTPTQGKCDPFGACIQANEPISCTAVQGWDDAPSSSPAFIVNSLTIAEADTGFDIDGACRQDGCIDNRLSPLAPILNDIIRQGLLGGELRLLVEFAGLQDPYRGDDESMTVKVYEGVDADDPQYPANDFSVPPGETDCCQFRITPQSLIGVPPQAAARAPARIERGRLRTLAPIPVQFQLNVGTAPHPPLRLERALISARVPSSLDIIDDGLLGGAIPVSALAQIDNPTCARVPENCPGLDSSLLSLVRSLVGPQPDVDLDRDGLECLLDTTGDGRIDRCCDGEEDACGRCTWVVPPVDPTKPESCALQPQMADGYSVGLTFTAVPAQIVGIE